MAGNTGRPTRATSFLGVPLGTLNKILKEDAIIHVSKRFLSALGMITEGHDGQGKGNKLPIVSELKEKDTDIVALKVDADW